MDYGKIEIQKIQNIDSYVEWVLTPDQVYTDKKTGGQYIKYALFSDDAKEVFKSGYDDTFEYLKEQIEERKAGSVLTSRDLAREMIKENTKLDLFSKDVYRAVLARSVYTDCGKIDPERLGRFCGKLKALSYLHDIATGPDVPSGKKLKWTGKPAQLGHIVYMLADLGYIEPPKKPNGDPNFNEFARILLDCFEISTTFGNMAKEVNPEKNTLELKNKDKFAIPHIKEIS